MRIRCRKSAQTGRQLTQVDSTVIGRFTKGFLSEVSLEALGEVSQVNWWCVGWGGGSRVQTGEEVLPFQVEWSWILVW